MRDSKKEGLHSSSCYRVAKMHMMPHKLQVISRKRAINYRALSVELACHLADKRHLATEWRRYIGCLISCTSFFAKESLIIGLFCGKGGLSNVILLQSGEDA